jgi:iron complex outermembrane receptor protein
VQPALLVGSALAALPLLSTSVLAQSQPMPGDQGASEQSGSEIIVTAQRRNELLEDVPMSVSVVNPETMQNLNINTVRDLANVTSGFQVNNSGSYPQPAIRGVTTTNAGSYENNIALFVDGLYQTTPQILNMDLPNVASIQVLKGPQGTLYGRNATGGAILIDTIEPGRTWRGNLEATYGRFDDKRLRGFVAGPLTEGIGISVAGTIRHTDGYYKVASRTTPGQFDGRGLGMKQESVRTKLKFDLSENFTATLAYNYLRASDPRGVIFTQVENVPNYSGFASTRPRGLGEVSGNVWDLDLKQHEGSLKLEWDSEIGTLRSVSGYTRASLSTIFDSGGTYVPDNFSSSTIRERTWQENLDFSVNLAERLDLVLGGNYYNIKTNFTPQSPNSFFLTPPGATPDTPLSDYRRSFDTHFFRTKEAWAVFADATYQITDRLSLNAGVRYSKERQEVSGFKNNFCTVTAGCLVGTNLVPLGSITTTPYTIASSARTSSYSKLTPRASVRFEITPGANIYASYSQGFRGGEWNSVIPSDNPNLWFDADQETIDAYEVGFKTARNGLRFELAGFLYNYKDLQVSSTAFINGVANVVLQNAPKAKIYGVEANVDFEIVENLTLRAGATWLHARYGDGFYFVGPGVTPVVGANTNADPLKTLINSASFTQNLSGLQMARAPDFTGFAGLDYNIPRGDGGIRFSANLKYTTSYAVTNPSVWGGDPTYNANVLLNPGYVPDNTKLLAGTPYVDRANEQRFRQGAFALLNASVTWTDPTDSYYVRVWGANLTNRIYRVHYTGSATGTYSPIGEPRTYGVSVGYKFGD